MARLYFVLCLVCSCSVSGQSPTYGLTGLKVTLKPDVTGTKQQEEILWKHNGNKVVEFDGRNQQDYGLFENRVTLDWISAELNITGLRLDDSGEYELDVYTDKVLKQQTLNLVVLEKLAKPNITCEKSNDGEEATLTCSVESRQPQYLAYEWISHEPGQRLTVPLSDKNKEYTCMVRNPLSNATATVTAKACYPDEGVSVTLIAILSVAVFLLVATVVACIIYCKKNNKACFTRDVEKTADERYGLNNETAHNEEGASLLHRTPTVPSGQRLGRENTELCKDETPVKGSVRKRIQEFEQHAHNRNSFQDTATGTKQPSCEGSDVPSNDNDADAEHLDPSHSEQETEAGGLNSEAPQNKQSKPPSGPTAPSGQQPVSPPQDDTNIASACDKPDYKNYQTDKEDGQSQMTPEGNVQEHVSNFENDPDNQTETKQSSCAETKQRDPLHPEQETEAGLNIEAPQSKQNNPPSGPTAPSGQQPVSPPQDDTNMTSTCDKPDYKNDQTDIKYGQSQMTPEDQQQQVRKDGGEQPPAKNTVKPPVPRPRLSQRFPPVETKNITECNKGADSNQVTDKTEENNVELSESEKNNDPNIKSQIGKSVSDKTKSDNNQSQSPPSPEKPDQSNSGELQESPDATHSDLDQQEQDKTGCDSPGREEQSDNTTTVSKEDQVPVNKLVQDIERKLEDQQNQVRKDGGEQRPAKNTVIPPVPMPHLSQLFPAVGTKDATEHTKGANSSQVTGKTKKEDAELSELQKNNDPNKNSQIVKSVSDKTKSDNNQSQSPPSPEKPDQSNSGELQESPDATHSDLDQQEQDKTGCDSPECEEQSDNTTTVSKEDQGKEEGDTDDNEGQCSTKEEQSDKESEDEKKNRKDDVSRTGL